MGKDKIPADDKVVEDKAIEETISWLDSNASAEKEEYEEKQKTLEAIANPILQSMAGAGGMPGGMPRGMPGGMPDMSGMPDMGGAPPAADPAGGPTIEEID